MALWTFCCGYYKNTTHTILHMRERNAIKWHHINRSLEFIRCTKQLQNICEYGKTSDNTTLLDNCNTLDTVRSTLFKIYPYLLITILVCAFSLKNRHNIVKFPTKECRIASQCSRISFFHSSIIRLIYKGIKRCQFVFSDFSWQFLSIHTDDLWTSTPVCVQNRTRTLTKLK